MDSSWSGNVGAVAVRELDWAVPAQAEAAGGPFEFVVAADCVYHEQIVEDFLRTVLTITDHRSTGAPPGLYPIPYIVPCVPCILV